MKTLSRLIAPLLLMLAVPAPAQTVYRCGNSYSQQPCPGGTAIDTSDQRTPEQRKAAADGAQHQRRTADTLEKQRVKDEVSASRAAQQIEKAEQAAAAKRAAQQAAQQKEKAREQKTTRTGRRQEPRYFTARDAAERKAHKKDAPPAGAAR